MFGVGGYVPVPLAVFEEPDGVRVKSTIMIEVSDSGCIVKQLKMSAHR